MSEECATIVECSVRMNTQTTFIYALLDPRTQVVRYIGKSDNPKRRLSQHLRSASWSSPFGIHRLNWIRSLLREGVKPKLEIIDEVSQTEWQAVEAAYVIFYRDEEGCDLVNTQPGGIGPGSGKDNPIFGRHHTLETRLKIGAAHKGRPKSAEQRANQSAATMGEKNPRFGKHLSEQTRLKISASNSGKKRSPETRAKISESKRGARHPLFGKQLCQLAREKALKAVTGKVHTAEQRANMSAAMTRYWRARKLQSL